MPCIQIKLDIISLGKLYIGLLDEIQEKMRATHNLEELEILKYEYDEIDKEWDHLVRDVDRSWSIV